MDATNAEQKMNNLVDGVWLQMMGSFHIEKGRIRGWNFVEDRVLRSGFFIIL